MYIKYFAGILVLRFQKSYTYKMSVVCVALTDQTCDPTKQNWYLCIYWEDFFSVTQKFGGRKNTEFQIFSNWLKTILIKCAQGRIGMITISSKIKVREL